VTLLGLVVAAGALGGGSAPTGIWESIGYGTVWVFDGDRLATFELTTTTCVASTGYRRHPATEPGVLAVYRADESIGAVAADWIIRATSTDVRLSAHTPGTVNDVHFRPLAELPARCRAPTPGTRAGTFEVFERTMAEHYAFFAERGMDWKARVAEGRRELPRVPSDSAFYHLLHEMLAPLEDAHTKIIAAPLGLRLPTYRRTARWLEGAELDRVRDLAPVAYLRDSLRRLDGGRLQYGTLEGNLGYLKVTAEYGFAGTGRFEDDSAAFERSLAGLMPAVARHRGLVLDLRINGGGYDANARLLAGALTDVAYPAMVKRARSDPDDPNRLTEPTVVEVVPTAGPRFTGPLVVLIGIRTISAGEVLGLMLLGRSPRPWLIGEPTQGVFADELVRRLPNGWQFQLTSERYATPDGRSFEGQGLEPDLRIEVFPPGERDGRTDRVLEAAIRHLRGR